MATIQTGSIQQSRFIGSPIMVPVQAASPAGNVTFHQVRLQVTVDDGNGVITTGAAEFEFAQPVANGEVAWFDISSAFIAFADTHLPKPDVLEYPHFSAVLNACDDYLADGVSYDGVSPSGAVTVAGKYLGALTDRERGAGISNVWTEPERYSRKPSSSPEIVFVGKTILRPVALMDDSTPQAPDADAIEIVAGGADPTYNCYAVPMPARGYEIRFINSLGVHENIFVSRLGRREVDINTEKYIIARQESLTVFSRGTAVKENDCEAWRFSSGALDEAWASWYIHELLMAENVWISVNGMWIPCRVMPEETTVLEDRDGAQPMEVQFRLEMDINGSPM